MFAALQTDGYKTFHKFALNQQIEKMNSNYTSRSGRLSNVEGSNKVAFVGLQYFIMDYLLNEWQLSFFNLDKKDAIKNIKRQMFAYLGTEYDTSHFESLHDLGYLPLEIKALPEGTLVPYQVAPFTVENTVVGFDWLVNYIETVMSCENWPIQTSTTTAIAYYKQFKKAFSETGVGLETIPFMGHDFSFRGMFGRQAAAMSGFGHLAAGFVGTDTIPAILFAEKYYGADVETELVGCSVPATEHSVVTSDIAIQSAQKGISKLEAEVEFVRRLLKENPKGILSHVSDSFDFWSFVEKGLPMLKEDIMLREGTFVVRPDSGDPVDVLCGSYKGSENKTELTAEEKGLVQCLYEIFGGTITDKGYKLLDTHIGAIYGDSITLDRQKEIHNRLIAKGFAPVVVLGIGSYSYQMVTRDTHGSAVKATNVTLSDGSEVPVCKDPKTDSKKKSAKGLTSVCYDNSRELVQTDMMSRDSLDKDLRVTVFKDGIMYNKTTLAKIRARIAEQL